MGKYTILEESGADQAVQQVLDMVVYEVASLLGDRVRAIVLMGGYGRGEGGVYKKNDQYYLVNDLDIAVFVNNNVRKIKKIYNNKLKEIADILLPKAKGLKQIDIDITSPGRFRMAPNLVMYYEIKNGHKVIYGNIDLANIMPKLTSKNLPLFDGANYFITRGSGLLLPLLYESIGCLDDEKYRNNFQIEMQKGCQAMGDSFLLMHGEYHVSYKERLRRFQMLTEQQNLLPNSLLGKLSPLYTWAVSNKLQPTLAGQTETKEMQEKFKKVLQIFSEYFLWFESKRLNKDFVNWYEYSKYVEHNSIQEPMFARLREIAKTSVEARRPVLNTKRKKLLTVMPLLLFVKHGSTEANRYLSRAEYLLNKWKFFTSENDWLSLTSTYLNAYHPHGAVGEALNLCKRCSFDAHS